MSALRTLRLPFDFWSLKKRTRQGAYGAKLDLIHPIASRHPELYLVHHLGCRVLDAIQCVLGDRLVIHRSNCRTQIRRIDRVISVPGHYWHVAIGDYATDELVDIATHPLENEHLLIWYGNTGM